MEPKCLARVECLAGVEVFAMRPWRESGHCGRDAGTCGLVSVLGNEEEALVEDAWWTLPLP